MLDKSTLTGKLADVVSPQEIARFDALAEQWWDPNGKYKTALAFNQARTGFMLTQLARHFGREGQEQPLSGLSVLDVGSGGGLISEALALAGATVTGIDPSSVSINVARRHALAQGLQIDYRHMLVEQLDDSEQFDIVINAEVVEHVPDQVGLIQRCAAHCRDDGMLVLATLNRTLMSWLIAIVGAEYVMRYLPVGTHSWSKFVKPEELQNWVAEQGWREHSATGMRLNPLSGKWLLTPSKQVNYVNCYTRADS